VVFVLHSLVTIPIRLSFIIPCFRRPRFPLIWCPWPPITETIFLVLAVFFKTNRSISVINVPVLGTKQFSVDIACLARWTPQT